MSQRIWHLSLGLLAILVAVSPASAFLTPVFPGNETPLFQGTDNIMDTLYGAGNWARIEDQGDQIWYNPDGQARAKAKYAGFTQAFGFIAGTVGMDFIPMFDVTGNGYNPDVTPRPGWNPQGGWFYFNQSQTGEYFRFGNDPSGAPLWSSRIADNSDSEDHMVTFMITGNSGAGYEDNDIGHYAIGWEDLAIGQGSDLDYNDLVVELGGVSAVPEPGTLVLLGVALALGGIGTVARRRRT